MPFQASLGMFGCLRVSEHSGGRCLQIGPPAFLAKSWLGRLYRAVVFPLVRCLRPSLCFLLVLVLAHGWPSHACPGEMCRNSSRRWHTSFSIKSRRVTKRHLRTEFRPATLTKV